MGIGGTLDLAAVHRATILLLLEEHLPGVTVWAYGSRVQGTSHRHSDLDLVVFATPEQGPRIADLREAFEESDLPFRVDLFVWDEVPVSFRERIAAEHAVLVNPDHSRGEWLDCTLAEVCSAIDYGLTASASNQASGPRFLRITDIVSGQIDWTSVPHVPVEGITAEKYRLHHGDVVLARTGASTGASAYVKSPPHAVFASYLVRLRARPGIEGRFLAYYLKSDQFRQYIRGVLGDKSAQPNASASTMTAAPLRAPTDPTEQRAIAGVLGALDDRIDLNRRMNETLEAMARALFKSWFVDFDPVRAKMEGRDPELPPKIADLFPDRLVESEVGEIPEGWEVSEIGKEVDAVGGATPSTNEPTYWSGGRHHWVTPRDLSKLVSLVLLETDRKITDAGVEKISSGLLPVGTVLLSSRAPIGYLAVAAVPTAINQGFIAMICRKRLSDLYVLFWCYENLDHIKGISGGSTFAEISKRVFRPIPVVVPPKRVLEAYEGVSRSLYDQIVSNARKRALLSAWRDTLLPRLVSGAVRLPATLVGRYEEAATTAAT